jgi:hypothetical protein
LTPFAGAKAGVGSARWYATGVTWPGGAIGSPVLTTTAGTAPLPIAGAAAAVLTGAPAAA